MSNTKVLVLCGKSGSGKTETLNRLIALFLDSGAAIAGGAPSEVPKHDTSVALNYCGKKIGVVTAGDNRAELEAGLGVVGNDCDLYVIACRTKGMTRGWIHEVFENAPIIYHMKWAILTISEEYMDKHGSALDALRSDANQLQADVLKKHVEYHCGNE